MFPLKSGSGDLSKLLSTGGGKGGGIKFKENVTLVISSHGNGLFVFKARWYT